MNAKTLGAVTHLFDMVPATQFTFRGERGLQQKNYAVPNPDYGATIWYHLKEKTDKPVRVRITNGKGEVMLDLIGDGKAGLNKVQWNLRKGDGAEAPPVPAGDYEVTLEAAGTKVTKKLKVEAEE
jgi:hypothetical protein